MPINVKSSKTDSHKRWSFLLPYFQLTGIYNQQQKEKKNLPLWIFNSFKATCVLLLALTNIIIPNDVILQEPKNTGDLYFKNERFS